MPGTLLQPCGVLTLSLCSFTRMENCLFQYYLLVIKKSFLLIETNLGLKEFVQKNRSKIVSEKSPFSKWASESRNNFLGQYLFGLFQLQYRLYSFKWFVRLLNIFLCLMFLNIFQGDYYKSFEFHAHDQVRYSNVNYIMKNVRYELIIK